MFSAQVDPALKFDLWILSGLLIWMLLSGIVNSGCECLVGSRGFILSFNIPKVVFIAEFMVFQFINHMIIMGSFVILIFLTDFSPSLAIYHYHWRI